MITKTNDAGQFIALKNYASQIPTAMPAENRPNLSNLPDWRRKIGGQRISALIPKHHGECQSIS